MFAPRTLMPTRALLHAPTAPTVPGHPRQGLITPFSQQTCLLKSRGTLHVHLLSGVRLQALHKAVQSHLVAKAVGTQLQLQLFKCCYIALHSAKLAQSQYLIPEFQLLIKVTELLFQLTQQYIEGQVLEDVKRVIRVAPPPSKGIIPEIRNKKAASFGTSAQTYSINVLAHHKKKVLQVGMLATKSEWLFNLHFPWHQGRLLLLPRLSNRNSSCHRLHTNSRTLHHRLL